MRPRLGDIYAQPYTSERPIDQFDIDSWEFRYGGPRAKETARARLIQGAVNAADSGDILDAAWSAAKRVMIYTRAKGGAK